MPNPSTLGQSVPDGPDVTQALKEQLGEVQSSTGGENKAYDLGFSDGWDAAMARAQWDAEHAIQWPEGVAMHALKERFESWKVGAYGIIGLLVFFLWASVTSR